MKTSSTTRPGTFCRVVRAWSAVTGDPSRGWTARHVASCACCREFFSASAELENRLRRTAPQQLRNLPQGFEQRMDRVIADVVREQRVTQSSGSRLVLWGGMAGAAATIALAFVLLRPATITPTIAERDPDPAAILDESVQVARELNDRFWNDVAPSANSLVQANPLQQEIGAVYADAQSALQFLALNFLPKSSTTSTPADTTPI